MRETDRPAEGGYMHDLAQELFPITRSITGDGVRQTLAILGRELPGLVVHEVPSGTQAFDWPVPDEWNIRAAYLEGPDGRRICDLTDSNLHVVSYSVPVDRVLSLEELQPHLHSIPELPEAIPYVTSYYNPTWGFCLTDPVRQSLEPGQYRAVIDSTLEPGSLTYADLVIPGESEEEVFVTTYVCHPSMANNELSGPMVATALARWVMALPKRRYTYRFAFAPETIGALVYASQHLEHLRSHVVAGFNLTCIGDDGHYSYLASRRGDLELDRIARHVLRSREPAVEYSYLRRGSDERQYGAPGIDLPMISLMRTKYGEFPQYHTSLDDLTFVTPTGLQGGLDLVRECVEALEVNDVYEATVLGEPQLGRRGLYHLVLPRVVEDVVYLRKNVLAYADGDHSVVDMAVLFDLPIGDVAAVVAELASHGLLRRVERNVGA
jgi:aminopeptidase-like protein